jgi:hypothetical protein
MAAYRWKAERERDNWMPLSDVVAHIEATTGGDKIFALEEVLAALADDEIPTRWAQETIPVYPMSPPQLFADDLPPTGYWFWTHAMVLVFSDYRVINQTESDTLATTGPRLLLLLRSKVLEFWPLAPPQAAITSLTAASPLKPARAGLDQIREAARKIYAAGEMPNIIAAEKLVREQLPNARRPDIRLILNEAEFVGLRKPAGNQKR